MDNEHLTTKSLNDDPTHGSGGASRAGKRIDGYLGVGWREKRDKGYFKEFVSLG